MDITYKVIIAVIAGLLVFTIMRKMTKWLFRIVIGLLFVAGLFYAYSHVEDIKAVFNEEMGSEEIVEPVANESIAANETLQNITEEIIIVEPIEGQAEPLPEQLPA